MMRNVILTQGQTAICDCPNTPGMLTAPFPRETATLSEKSSLWSMDNVLIQPHVSAASPHYMQLYVEELADEINNLNSK